MRAFFVEVDSYAIASFFFLSLFEEGERKGGNSMGLILEARSYHYHYFLFLKLSWMSTFCPFLIFLPWRKIIEEDRDEFWEELV